MRLHRLGILSLHGPTRIHRGLSLRQGGRLQGTGPFRLSLLPQVLSAVPGVDRDAVTGTGGRVEGLDMRSGSRNQYAASCWEILFSVILPSVCIKVSIQGDPLLRRLGGKAATLFVQIWYQAGKCLAHPRRPETE